MRARPAVAALVLLVLAACGDDGKQGSRGAPAAPPVEGPAAPGLPGPGAPVAPAPAGSPVGPTAGPGATPGVATAPRVGDWVRWEVRATGVRAATSLRWTVVAVEADRVRLRVESGPLDDAGAVIGARTTEVWAPTPTRPDATGAPEAVPVGTRTVTARSVTRGEFTAWYADEVPLGGLVRSRGPGGVEQVALDFGRGS